MLTWRSARHFRSSSPSWIGRGSGSSSTCALGSSIRRGGDHIHQMQQVSVLPARALKPPTSPGGRVRWLRPLQAVVATHSSRTVTFMQLLNRPLIRNGLALPYGDARRPERSPSGGAVRAGRLVGVMTGWGQEGSAAWCDCATCVAWLLCVFLREIEMNSRLYLRYTMCMVALSTRIESGQLRSRAGAQKTARKKVSPDPRWPMHPPIWGVFWNSSGTVPERL